MKAPALRVLHWPEALFESGAGAPTFGGLSAQAIHFRRMRAGHWARRVQPSGPFFLKKD